MIEPFIAAGAVMLASLTGAIFVHQTARKFLEERLAYLVSFSAGVFLVTAGALALETLELFGSTLVAIGWIGAGYVIAWGVHYLLPETHHHHDTDCHRGHAGARKLIVGDGIHNIADGIILVTAFAVSPALGLAVTVSVLVHEALQEVSEFFVLRQAGYRVRTALLVNFAVSSTLLIGVGVGLFALQTLLLEGILLALSAGFFLHVVVHDLLPKRSAHAGHNSRLAEHVLLVALGVMAMASIQVLAGGAHIHGDGHDHAEHESHDEHEEHADENIDSHFEEGHVDELEQHEIHI